MTALADNGAEMRLLAWLERCAAAGAAAPTNDVICERFGYSSKSSAVRLLDRLEWAGLIERERSSNSRTVTITASGQRTGVGGFVGGSTGRGRHRIEKLAAEKLPAPHQIIDRTPCPRCAVRADIGCRHQPRGVAL